MSKAKYCPECASPLMGGRCSCGWQEGKSDAGVEPIPELCMVEDCEELTAVAWSWVEYMGKRFACLGSKALYRSGGLKERQDYRFIRWITRCSRCYLRMMDTVVETPDPAYQKIKELRKSNPELFFKPTNEQECAEYAEMMLAYMKRSAQQVMKLPYDKNRSHVDFSEEILTGREIGIEDIERVDTSKYRAA